MLKLILLMFFLSFQLFPQSFGFGCFGFVGGYGGYSYQKYEPGLINEAINRFNATVTSQVIPKFGSAQGYRIGIIFYRAKFSGVFITSKGYYESISESQSYSYYVSNSKINSELDFSLKSWNVGIDFGIPISNLLSWKILDGAVHFYSANLINKPSLSDNVAEIRYKNDNPEIGYFVGTGFIISIQEDFLNLEGTFGYTFLKIKKMINEYGSEFFLGGDLNAFSEKDFIKSGGLSVALQLNVGFPL